MPQAILKEKWDRGAKCSRRRPHCAAIVAAAILFPPVVSAKFQISGDFTAAGSELLLLLENQGSSRKEGRKETMWTQEFGRRGKSWQNFLLLFATTAFAAATSFVEMSSSCIFMPFVVCCCCPFFSSTVVPRVSACLPLHWLPPSPPPPPLRNPTGNICPPVVDYKAFRFL